MGYLTDEEKSDLEKVMENIHDTFARTLYGHVEGQITVISEDPSYNSIYSGFNDGQNATHTITTSKTEFRGRILYGDKQELKPTDIGDENSLKISLVDGQVRIKVDQTGKDFVESAKKIEIDGRLFQKDSVMRPHGLFRPKFYTYHLKTLE